MLQLVQVCLIFVFVLAITYAATKFIAGYQKNVYTNRSMQILTSMKVGTNKYIQVVKVADKYLVIGVSKDQITMLTELSEEEAMSLKTGANSTGAKFSENLNEVMKKMKNKLPKK
jgi:flagellar protein FliO/FliZ